MIYLLNIDESSMKQGWITDEWIAKFTCSTASSIFIIPYQIEQNHWVEKQKSKNRTLNEKNWLMFLKLIPMRREEHFGRFFLRKIIKLYMFLNIGWKFSAGDLKSDSYVSRR